MTRSAALACLGLVVFGAVLSSCSTPASASASSGIGKDPRGPLDSGNPTFTISLSYYDAPNSSTLVIAGALTGWLFFNDSGIQQIENFSVTNGAEYTYQNFSSLSLTNISSVIVEGANASGYPNAIAPLVSYGNLTQTSSVTVVLNFSAPSTLPSGGSSSSGSSLPSVSVGPIIVQLTGVGVFVLVAYVGVRGWKKIVRPIFGSEGGS